MDKLTPEQRDWIMDMVEKAVDCQENRSLTFPDYIYYNKVYLIMSNILNSITAQEGETDNQIAKRKIEEFYRAEGLTQYEIVLLARFNRWLDRGGEE